MASVGVELVDFSALDAAAKASVSHAAAGSAAPVAAATPAATAAAATISSSDGFPLLPANSGGTRAPSAGLRARVWEVMDDPSASRLGSAIALVVTLTVLLSVTAFVVQTLPQFIFSTAPVWTAIEIFCVVIFTAELAARAASAPSLRAFCSPLILVDILAVAPFYVELAAGGMGGSGLSSIVRALRLVRIFRVFKIMRYLPWVRVFSAALAQSALALLMLVVIVLIGVVIFASLMYYAERGDWNAAAGTWLRTDDYGDVSPSPFYSIPAAMWWAVITMTTVGYGDMFPVTALGRAIATLAALSGVLVVAVPITIISTNFNAEAARLETERARVRARMQLLQQHFAAKRAGLDAVLDEVADIVRRNAQELEGEVATLLAQTRDELTAELQEIVRMAYEKRRLLHLRALAAQATQEAQTNAASPPPPQSSSSSSSSPPPPPPPPPHAPAAAKE